MGESKYQTIVHSVEEADPTGPSLYDQIETWMDSPDYPAWARHTEDVRNWVDGEKLVNDFVLPEIGWDLSTGRPVREIRLSDWWEFPIQLEPNIIQGVVQGMSPTWRTGQAS